MDNYFFTLGSHSSEGVLRLIMADAPAVMSDDLVVTHKKKVRLCFRCVGGLWWIKTLARLDYFFSHSKIYNALHRLLARHCRNSALL